MQVKLPKEYSGRQILDAFKAAIVAQNTQWVFWESKEEPDRVSYEISSAKVGEIKTVVYRRASAVPLKKDYTLTGVSFFRRPPVKMEGGALMLAPLREGGIYDEFKLSFKNVPPEKEGMFVGQELGILTHHFLLKLIEELRKSEAPAIAA